MKNSAMFSGRWLMAAATAFLLAGCQTGTQPSSNQTGSAPSAVASSAVAPTPAPAPTPAAAPAPAGAILAIRINAGTTAPYTDSSGNAWLPDQGFADGETIERAGTLPIANTKDPALYRSERYSMTSFSRPLPNGKYIVKLHFAETFEEITEKGQRVFSFSVEGQEFKDFDVFSKAGGAQRAYVETVPVTITDGALDIKFTSNIQNPEINAIEILPGS